MGIITKVKINLNALRLKSRVSEQLPDTEPKKEEDDAQGPVYTSGSIEMDVNAIRAARAEHSISGKHPDRRKAAVIHVAFWPYDHVLENLSPEDAVSALNEFFQIGANTVRSMGGVFDRSSSGSFFGSWLASDSENQEQGFEAVDALKCALALRQEFVRFNLSRKTDGVPELMFVMGADWGHALSGSIGPEGERHESIVGEVVAQSRALSQICVSVGTDFLVSQAMWTPVEGAFSGRRIVEASLSVLSGLTDCYAVEGYRDGDGNTVTLPRPVIPQGPTRSARMAQPQVQQVVESNRRWMVNNGSQIVGPLSEIEIAQRLYALDFDFDCECWVDGKGNRITIASSGMFGGSDDINASVWVFDGQMMHGPMTEGFLKTAVRHGAFGTEAMCCEVSTVNGWKRISEHFPNVVNTTPEAHAQAQAKREAEAEAAAQQQQQQIQASEPMAPLSLQEAPVPVEELVKLDPAPQPPSSEPIPEQLQPPRVSAPMVDATPKDAAPIIPEDDGAPFVMPVLEVKSNPDQDEAA